MNATERRRRRRAKAAWRIINPPTKPMAGIVPWLVLLETTGRRSGLPRTTPLAAGPTEEWGIWLLAAHGRHADYVANLLADPRVRLRHRGAWHAAEAAVHPLEPEVLRRFNAYARAAVRVGIDPLLIRIAYATPSPD